MLSIIRTAIRKYFARDFNNGAPVDATMLGSLDAQIADMVVQGNQMKDRLEAISTPAGGLRYNLAQTQRFVATAGQTAFTLTNAYVPAQDVTVAFTNGGSGLLDRIDDNSVVQTSSTVVTLPAQVAGAIVIIETRSVGNPTSQLQSTTVGQGSALVGYSNPNALSAQTTIEGAVADLYAKINSGSFLGGIIGTSGFLTASGSVNWAGNQNANGNKVTGLGAGTANSNDAARMVDINSAAIVATIQPYLAANYMPSTGIAGDVQISGGISTIQPGVITPAKVTTASGGLLQAGRNAIIDGTATQAHGTALAMSSGGTTSGYGAVDMVKGKISGLIAAATLGNTIVGAVLGRATTAAVWSSITNGAGAGVLSLLYYVEAAEAMRLGFSAAAQISAGAQVYHHLGVACNVTLTVSYANSADNFGAVTQIGTQTVSVNDNQTTWVQFPNIGIGTSGNPQNGVVLQIDIAVPAGYAGAGTVAVSEVQLELGAACTPYEYEHPAIVQTKVRRYIEYIQNTYGNFMSLGWGSAPSATRAVFAMRFKTSKRVAPSVHVASTLQVGANPSSATAISGAGGPIGALVDLDGFQGDYQGFPGATFTSGQVLLLISTATTDVTYFDARF